MHFKWIWTCYKRIFSDTTKLLRELGCFIQTKKSVLTPSQIIVFLGFIISSKNMILSLTDEKNNTMKFEEKLKNQY